MPAKRDIVITLLIDLAAHAQIAHHIPGRIRLKIKPSGIPLAMKLDPQDLGFFTGVRSVRSNTAARSVVIDYDEQKIPFSLWEKLLKAKAGSEVRNSVQQALQKLASPELDATGSGNNNSQ